MCDLDSDVRIRNVCERSLLYNSVFSIFLVAHYAHLHNGSFSIENHGKFTVQYLEL